MAPGTGDSMKKVRTGDPLVVPAQAYNAFIDAAKDYHQRTANLGQQATPGYRSAGIVLVKNESGEDRARFDVLGLGDPIFLPDTGAVAEQSFKNVVAFRGDMPDETLHQGKFVILLEPLAAGAIGRAYLAGVTVARLRLEDAAQQVTHAEIIDADATALQPSIGGSAAVLWHQEPSEGGDVWAIVRLGNAAPAGVWVQITSTEANGGQYASWQEVELSDDGSGGLTWSAVADGMNGTEDGALYEVNGIENIPADTVAQAFANPAYDPQAASGGAAWLFQYEQPEIIGFGIPADGEVDVPHDADIDLIVTDVGGNPILDDESQQQTIKVWRNALKRSLYTDFQSGDVFVYVKFPQPAPGSGGVEGCIFSRTEAFKNYREWLPDDGYSLYPNQEPPATTDITGDPGNEDHVHVIGKMYMSTDAEGKGWAPWFVIDPEAFGSFKVKTDDTDDTPGYLNDEIQVGENPGQPHTWIRKRVNDEPAPGSDPDANDHKLRLYHGDWDAANTNKTGNLLSLGAPGANVQVVDGAVDPGPGTAWFTFTEYEDEYDDKKHGKVRAKAGAKKLVIDGIGKVFTDANDTTPGFLDAEVTVTPAAGGHEWLKKSVQPGGAADNKLLLEHNVQGPKDSEIDPIAVVAVVDVDGTPTLRITARKSGHDARGHHTGDAGNQDHDVVVADEKVKSWEEDPNAGYLLDKIEGDGFWIVKSLQDNRIVLEHGPPQWEDPNYTVVFEGDPHIEVLEGSAGFGDPKIPVDANGHIISNLGIQVTHKYPQDETWTLDPVVSLSLNGTSLRVTSKPASVDSKGHMRQGDASEQYHDLSMEAVTVVTAFRVEGTDLQVKTRTIYVPKADAESDWTTVHTGTECPSSGGS